MNHSVTTDPVSVSRRRRYLLPAALSVFLIFVCGKLLLTPVKTTYESISRPDYRVTTGAVDFGWPWVFWKRFDGKVIPPNPTRLLDIFYSRGLLLANLAVLTTGLLVIVVVSSWLWRRAKYRIRYSLRGLLLMTVVIGAPLGWLARHADQYRHEQQHIALLREENIFRIADVETAPAWLRRLWPEERLPIFRHAWGIEIDSLADHRQKTYGAVLEAALYDMPDVHKLTVDGCKFRIGDPSAYANIQELSLGRETDDLTLQRLAKLPALGSLSISSNLINDNGLAELSNCGALERLTISWHEIGEIGIEHLAKMKNLRHLDFSIRQVSDAAIDALVKMPVLEELELHIGREATDRSLSRLAELPKLKALTIHGRPWGLPNDLVQVLNAEITTLNVK